MSLSVVIPTHERALLLPRILAPLLADDGAIEVVVVVDGSTDGSLELLQAIAAEHPKLRPLWHENRGKEATRQAGVEAARGELVLLLDDDVLAAPGLATGHAAAHDAEDAVVVGYSPVALPDHAAGNASTLLYAAEYEGACRGVEADPDSVLRRLWGGNLSLRRADALRVGFLSPAFRERYHQDQDFGLRCRRAGLRGRFRRDLRATHLHHRPLSAFRRDARHQGAGRRELRRLHPDQLEPLTRDHFAAGLPGPLRAVVLACRRPRTAAAGGALLGALARAAVVARAHPVETAALKLLRRIEQQRGALATG
jgi:glycosyltransferase involved in cell wall biosynthesis